MTYRFEIEGRIIPYVRMTQRSKYSDPRAKAYLASQTANGLQVKSQMSLNGWDMLPGQTPLFLAVVFAYPGGWHNKDVDNQYKAVADACNGVVYPDDRWIDLAAALRVKGGREVAVALVGTMDELAGSDVLQEVTHGLAEEIRRSE